MREGWNTAKLADLCEFRNGLWKGKKPPFVHVGVIRNTNFRADGSLDDSDIAFLDVEQKQFEKRSLQYGDLILEKSGGGPKQPVGRVVLFDKKDGLFSFSNFTSVIRVVDSARLDFNYLHRVLYWYYLSGTTESMQRRSTGIRNLEFSAYKALDIPLPPLPEQKRIVAILDEAFAGIATAVANTEKNLANARELFESYLNSVFNQRGEGWEDTRLSEVCTLSSGGTPSKKKASYWNGDIPWVSGRDMKSTRLSDSALHVSEAAVKESSTRVAPAGTILVLVRGMGLAHGAQLAELIAPCAFNQDIRGVHPNSNMVPRFLLFALRDRINSSDRVLRSAAHGTLKLDSTELVNLVIPVPPVSQQEQIVADVDRIAEESLHLKTIYQQKLNALSELKQSLLQKAFSGELTTAPPDEIETALA